MKIFSLLRAAVIAYRLWSDRRLSFSWASAWRTAKRRVGGL
mgnify:CR=1 FL=1